MEDNRNLSLENALRHALWARNIEIGRLGEAPFKIIYVRAPIYPGVLDGDLTTDNNINASEAVRNHFEQMEKARILYWQADYSWRLMQLVMPD